jgi:hypothetical protein
LGGTQYGQGSIYPDRCPRFSSFPPNSWIISSDMSWLLSIRCPKSSSYLIHCYIIAAGCFVRSTRISGKVLRYRVVLVELTFVCITVKYNFAIRQVPVYSSNVSHCFSPSGITGLRENFVTLQNEWKWANFSNLSDRIYRKLHHMPVPW